MSLYSNYTVGSPSYRWLGLAAHSSASPLLRPARFSASLLWKAVWVGMDSWGDTVRRVCEVDGSWKLDLALNCP